MKLIVDCDIGIDDAYALLAALNAPQVEVIAVTSTFGNVYAELGAYNALRVLELANRTDIPVYVGSERTLSGEVMTEVSSYVHGEDGLGNTYQPLPDAQPIFNESAAAFIARIARENPGEIHVLAIGPLTNVALALQLESDLPEYLAGLNILGGAYFVSGNINPAAEANIYNDALAADLVFSAFPQLRAVGLDVTLQTYLTPDDVDAIEGVGPYGDFLAAISRFYMNFYEGALGTPRVVLHDATAFLAVIRPELFEWRESPVAVATDPSFLGKTLMDQGVTHYSLDSVWLNRTSVSVALDVEAATVVQELLELLELV